MPTTSETTTTTAGPTASVTAPPPGPTGSAGPTGAVGAVTFTQIHQMFMASCTGDGTCHGNGTDMGVNPHPEFANTDEAVAKGYVDAKIDAILTRINSAVTDPSAFGMRRMPPSDFDAEGLSAENKAMVQAYADTVQRTPAGPTGPIGPTGSAAPTTSANPTTTSGAGGGTGGVGPVGAGGEMTGAGGAGGTGPAGAGGMGAGGGGSNGVTFTEVHAILVANCGDAMCHGEGANSGQFPHGEYGNPDEATAKGFVDDEIDAVITRITSDVTDSAAFGTRRMPPSDVNADGLSAEEIATIQEYANSL